jgi:ABC-type amino acid transport system permease subunit
MAFFPGCSSLLPFLLSILLFLPSLTSLTSSSERFLLISSGLTLQQPRCAIRGSLLFVPLVLSVLTLFAVMEHAKPEQIDFGTTIHASFYEFEPIHIPF